MREPVPEPVSLEAQQRPSPNFGDRRDGAAVSLIVLHYTAMTDAEGAIRHLCNPASQVSAHYLICPAGRLTQMVPDEKRAWHAGAGRWRDITDVNSHSIGIELANDGVQPFPEPQMAKLESLLAALMQGHGVQPQNVIAHSDMAPGRKIDPGPRFDWHRLARSGLAHWPEPPANLPLPDPQTFLHLARAAGYTADAPLETLLAAFRLRFCPWNTGPLNETDMACLSGL